MMRPYGNKKWTKSVFVAIMLFTFVIPLISTTEGVHADEVKVTVLDCYNFVNSGGGATIYNEQGQEISQDELQKVCETNRDESLENVTVNGEQVCKDMKSLKGLAWSSCLDEVNKKSGGKAGEIAASVLTDPALSPDEPGASNNNGANGNTDDSGGAGGGTEDAKDCMSSGGAKTLGWIVCPALNWMTDAVQGIYDTFLEPALQVDPQLFTGAGGATFNGWEFFRNLANGLLIVLLLFVIFSQVTGVGIDNYGIKKTLPKIIIGAILMNLSYWICIAAVDVSNILGNGFQQMFAGLTPEVTEVAGASVGEGLKATAISVAVLVTIAGSAGAIWALSDGLPGILLLLLVGAITVLVSIITLFIILAAREAAIVVLVVLSPLAMACYMLPNTKGLFDKWVKFMQSLLLVYPIAGLLVGGGNYVSGLLLGAGLASDWFGAITAMIAGIIPIFFIPTVLRRSLSFAGDIGNKISGVGRNVGRRSSGAVDKGVRSTEAWKRGQEYRANQRKVGSARRVNARLTNKQLRGGTLSAKEQDRMAQAQKVLTAQRQRVDENQNLSDSGYRLAERRKQDLQNENARRDVLMYNNADVVTSTLTKAENQRRQQLVEAHDWSNVAHVAAMENKQDTQHAIAEGELMLHLNPVVNQGEVSKAANQVQQKLNETTKWADTTYANAQGVRVNEESEQERLNTLEWVNDPNKVAAEMQKGGDARVAARAGNKYMPPVLTQPKAEQRAESRMKSAQFKDYQDQFVRYDRAALQAEASSASSWLGDEDGEMRMSALLGAMQSNGMENDIYDMLRTNNVSNMSNVMQTLASSSNKVMKAYGKKGKGIDYNTFMTGNGANSFRSYVSEKGGDFVNGLDDKSMGEIAKQDAISVSAGNGHLMSDAQISQAASQLKDVGSITAANQMMIGRDMRGSISGAQLAGYDNSTIETLRDHTTNGHDVILIASDAVANDPQLAGKMKQQNKDTVNAVRTASGRTAID